MLRSGKRRCLQRYWTSWLASRANRRVLQGFQEQIQAQVLRSTQRRLFGSWKQFVATRKIEKAMLLMSSAFAGTQLLGRMWIYWREYVAQTRATKARIRGVLAHMQLHRQFQVFRALRDHNLLQKWKKHADHRARTFRAQWLATQGFSNWRTAVKTLRDRREKLMFYLNLLQHSLQKKSFGAWSAFVSQRKTLRLKMAQALAMRTQMCSRTVFQTWKTFASKSQRNRKAQEFLAAKTSVHAIKHWRQYVLLCKVERMMGTSLTRQLEACFISWRKTVALTHQIRAFRAKSARRQWLEQVRRVFRSWQQRSSLHTRCRKLLASAALGNHLRFRFLLWQQFTVQRKRLAKMLLIVADPPQTLPTDLPHSEGENLVLSEDGAASTEHVDIEAGQAQSSDSQDRELVSVARALAQKARILQRFDVTWDLPQAWHRWRQIFHAQLFYRMRRMQFCFLNWQQFAHRRRRSRWIVIKLTRQREASSVQSLFQAWAQLVARVKQLQRERLRERELWVIVTTEMARRERRQLKSHWHAWKFHVDEARHLRASLNAYYRARLVTKHWLVWRHDFHQFVADARRKTERVDGHMGNFRLRRALRELREHQQRSKQQSTQRRALRHWSSVAWTCSQTREDKLETAARHETLALQRQCVNQWRIAVKKQRERRFVLLSCVVKLKAVASQRVVEVVYRAWKRVVQRERRCRVVLFKRECNAGRRALSQWLAWTQDRQRMRKKLESAAEYHAKRLAGAVFFYWQTYALAWQDAAKPRIPHIHELRQPLLVKAEAATAECDDQDDDEDSETDVRRPMSPVMKRLREKKARRTKEGVATGNGCEIGPVSTDMADVVTFPEAVELTMDVKKRLLLLGKWKPPQKSLLPRT
ncbi:hypothetical protein BBJ28_00014789 [Nothophytophthora sp. Chile5]|nr:hypothetical protein BBJ28_00014789 [Nothophytophthora sp. Chile5]